MSDPDETQYQRRVRLARLARAQTIASRTGPSTAEILAQARAKMFATSASTASFVNRSQPQLTPQEFEQLVQQETRGLVTHAAAAPAVDEEVPTPPAPEVQPRKRHLVQAPHEDRARLDQYAPQNIRAKYPTR